MIAPEVFDAPITVTRNKSQKRITIRISEVPDSLTEDEVKHLHLRTKAALLNAIQKQHNATVAKLRRMKKEGRITQEQFDELVDGNE
jgi:TfoX/Sxy family transcriptional regulator of competence genes